MNKVSTLTILILLLSHLMAEATTLLNRTVDYQDPAGYVTLRAHKEVYSTESGGSYYVIHATFLWRNGIRFSSMLASWNRYPVVPL